MTDKPASETPRTDAAWGECVRQGGIAEPFHGPLIAECSKLEHELSAALEQNERLREQLAAAEGEVKRVRARLNWAANELLACDYGDNPEGKGVGWTVFGWRDVMGIYSIVPYDEARRIYGATIDEAIDQALTTPGSQP